MYNVPGQGRKRSNGHFPQSVGRFIVCFGCEWFLTERRFGSGRNRAGAADMGFEKSIVQALEYIDDNLKNDISVADVASIAG